LIRRRAPVQRIKNETDFIEINTTMKTKLTKLLSILAVLMLSATSSYAQLTATIIAQTNVSCVGNVNGTATVVASGGTAPYAYSWSTSPVQITPTAINLPAGNYTVTVTDALNATATATVSITQPSSALTASVSIQHANVACYGDSSGTVTVTASGGTGPYTYIWNTTPVQTTATVTNLPVGTYAVIVVDANGCMTSVAICIMGPASPLTANISAQTNVTCTGNGSATVSASGGTAPYTYSWNTTPAQTSATATNLAAGNYTVTVTDANGCTATASVTITQAASLNASISSQTNVSCFGNTNGSATVSVSGGTAPYSYSWNTSPVQTSATASNLAPGNYVVTVTDANGCTGTASVTITTPPALSAMIHAQTNVSCFGGSTGSATVMGMGGTAPYTYVWYTSPNQTGPTATNLPAGTYAVIVTDANGCFVSIAVCITEPAAGLAATISSQTNVSCFGNTNGSATVSVSGGTAPYTYLWNTSPAQTSATANNLPAGTYVVTVTDSAGCTATASVTISQPANTMALTISAQSNVSCFGNTNGSATVSVSGGTAPYTYSWNTSPVQTSATVNNLAAGTYVVTVTDANGCSASANVNITQPASSIAVSVSAQTNVSCFGNTNGSATVTVSGGAAPYTYSWNTSPVQTGATVNNLSAGMYVVTVTDANGCTGTASVTITQPASTISASISAQQNVACFNGTHGSATVSVSGGTAPYTYSWNTTPVQTSATATNLPAGNYVVTITDANGCSTTASVTITQPAALLTAMVSAQTNVSCFGGNTGSATAMAMGGTAPYYYSWNSTPAQFTATATNLVAGNYTVTIADANGCTATATISITEPAVALAASISAQANASCNANDGSATVTASGGIAPYTYSWNTQPAQLTATATNLAAGTYTVFVMDANNCSASATVTIGQDSSSLTANATASFYNGSNISCLGANDGYININVSGGTAPYTYAWTGPSSFSASSQNISGLVAGAYNLIITDAAGCSITLTQQLIEPASAVALITSVFNGDCITPNSGSIDLSVSGGTAAYTYAWTGPNFTATTEDISGLAGGSYVVTVTDANGCTASVSVGITPQSSMALALQASLFNGYNISCADGNNGDIDLSVTGGNPAYTYAWNGPNGFTSSAQDVNGLYPGAYTVTVTDANGCSVTAQSTLTAPASMSAIFTTVDAQCTSQNGALATDVAGGVGPYTYLWSNGSTQANVLGLTAGNYTVTVTDANGCAMVDTGFVGSASTLATAYEVTNPTCNGSNEGAITLTVLNGTAPYTYAWSTGATLNAISGLSGGLYICTTNDSNGCVLVDSIQVNAPAGVAVTVTSPVYTSGHNISVMGGSDGSIDLTVTSGTAPYTFAWSNGATTEDISGLAAGTYTVTVTDSAGCFTTASIVLTEPFELVMPNGFSPNADGANDFFVVQGLDNFPNNRIQIFNRWGNLVYETEHYTNDWPGISNKGDVLPDATYFVVLEVNDGEIKLNSYVDLRR
jgi:gliding motility-associated-like protein